MLLFLLFIIQSEKGDFLIQMTVNRGHTWPHGLAWLFHYFDYPILRSLTFIPALRSFFISLLTNSVLALAQMNFIVLRLLIISISSSFCSAFRDSISFCLSCASCESSLIFLECSDFSSPSCKNESWIHTYLLNNL